MKMGKIGEVEKAFHDKLYEEVPSDIKSKYEGRSGIYALVRTDKEEDDPTRVLYIGQASNFIERWVSHKTNALCPDAREYDFHLYDRMRETKAHGIPMAFTVLEFCGLSALDEREEELLRQYKPPFNYRLPAHDKGMGWYKRPQLHVIE